MTWDGYYALGGVELVNEERFRTYVENVAPSMPIRQRDVSEFEGLFRAVGDNAYSTPLEDRAPWVDINDPITHGFLGMTILSVEGLDGSSRLASMTESLGRGGTMGDARDASKEIRFTAILAGTSAESVQAGMSWLDKVLWLRGTEQPLTPMQEGLSDLRFFAQRPLIPEQVVNAVQNPSGIQLAESLIGAAGQAYAFRTPNGTAGDWAYKIRARLAGDAEAVLVPLERPVTMSGQQWVARARLWRSSGVLGHRELNLLLRFRDQYGNIILGAGPNDTSVPDGVLYRWKGAQWDSISQRLDIAGMIQNFIVNPSGEGTVLGLGTFGSNAARVALANSTALTGPRAYQVTANTTGLATVRSATTAPAQSGQQWWGRGRGKLTKAYGKRTMRADLSFVNKAGTEIARVQGDPVTLAPTGTFRRWRGTTHNSVSEEYTNGVRRLNYNPNPTVQTSLAGYSGAGNARVSRERHPYAGTTHMIRVDPPAKGGSTIVGLNLPASGLPLGKIYLTFWIVTNGRMNLQIQGAGWTATGDGGTDKSNTLPLPQTYASVPVRMSVALTITKANPIIRIAQTDNSNGNPFRVGRVGLLTTNDTYFDGDTGRYEWEGTAYQSFSIAHLPGDHDAINLVGNPGFEKGIGLWIQQDNVKQSWDKANKRIALTTTGAVASGSAFAADAGHSDIVDGARVHVAGRVFNLGTAAVKVASQLGYTGRTNSASRGATVTIPAGGNAWVSTTAPISVPGGTKRVTPQFIAVESLPSGSKLAIDRVVMFAGADTAAAPVIGDWFDGATAKAAGAQFSSSAFDFAVGGVAPEGTTGAILLLHRLNDSISSSEDRYLADSLMLTQVTPDDDGDDDTPIVATMPDYFDGSFDSTYDLVPTITADSDPGDGLADTSKYDVAVTATAPPGAVTAELAVQRPGSFDAAANDVFYADNLLLATFADEDPPEYTTLTRSTQIAETERWLQEVYAKAGPTPIQQWSHGPGGCRGYTAQVEFTVGAENPRVLRVGDVVPLPLPSTVSQTALGAGSFAKLTDATGVVRNFMPQFAPGSAVVPGRWATAASTGSVTPSGVRSSSTGPYVLRVAQGTTASKFVTSVNAQSVLGASGGYEAAIASVWIGASNAGAQFTVVVNGYDDNTLIGSASTTFTAPASGADIFHSANRVDLPLPASTTGGRANGFTIVVTATSVNFGSAYIGNPQVTLGATAFPQIYGGMPDDEGYTYAVDAAGFSTRTPVARTQSRTVFPNLTAAPLAIASTSGYNEVGLSSYRAFAAIPAAGVPANAGAVPVLRLDFDRLLTRQVRIRFYPNPNNVAPNLIDLASFEHEWVLRPFHANIADYAASDGYMSLVVDGVAERVWLRAYDGTVISGDQYFVTSEGAPLEWPEFRGMPWVVSIDYPTFHQSSAEPSTETWWRASLALMIEE